MKGSYHDMHEPAWPGKSALLPSERTDWLEEMGYRGSYFNTKLFQRCINAENTAVKVADTAIAHAQRDSRYI